MIDAAVLVTETINSSGIELLKNNGIEILKGDDFSEDEIKKLNQKTNLKGIIVRTYEIPEELYNDTLRVISKHGAGIDNIDLDLANKKNIIVTNTPGANSNAVAEFTIALLFNISREICYAQRQLIGGDFFKTRNEVIGQELENKNLGIFGLGSIGTKIAQKCKGLNMNILAYDPFQSVEYAEDIGVTLYKDKNRVLEKADYISINMPLNDETENFITMKELKLMKNESYLINTSRGGIVNEEDLIKALKNNYISGAALDVFVNEPPEKNNPLFNMRNVIKTPHIGAQTNEALRNMSYLSSENLLKVLKGETPKNVMNPNFC